MVFRISGSGFRFQGLRGGFGDQECRKLNAEGSNDFGGSKNQLQLLTESISVAQTINNQFRLLKQSIPVAQIIISGCSNNQYRLLKQSISVAQTIKFGCPNNQLGSLVTSANGSRKSGVRVQQYEFREFPTSRNVCNTFGVRNLIAHKVLLKSFRKSQLPHKSVNLFIILVIVKDELTNLWGS